MDRVTMFMDFLGYGNHVELYSEEISRGGEGLGVSPTEGTVLRTHQHFRTHLKLSLTLPLSRLPLILTAH